MKKELPYDSISINKKSNVPIYKQLYDCIRKSIISNQFAANNRLPSTRQLSNDLNISRSTVTAAYDQLIAEGYLHSIRGSGTLIAETLRSTAENTNENSTPYNKYNNSLIENHNVYSQLSEMAKPYANPKIHQRIRTNYQQTALMPGIPSRHNFPNAIWGKLLGKHAKKSLGIDAGYDYPSGIPALKKAISDYIRLARGVNTNDNEVLIVTSTQAALDVLCRVLINKGDTTGIEDPGYRGAYIAMRNSSANIIGIPLDKEGITLPNANIFNNTPAKIIYTSPSHQYPTGVTMSYSRRMALLEYAHQHNTWIFEDDYDSEFRYRGKPLPCLQGLDNKQRVIYIGTFSKSLSPSMRVAYIVAPPALSPIINTLLGDLGSGVNLAVQYALAEFIEAGHYSRHIRKARKEYSEKQQTLYIAIKKYLSDSVDYSQSNAGIQATLYFKESSFKTKISDTEFVSFAEKEGLYLRALSPYYQAVSTQKERPKQGIILGFAACENNEIEEFITKLSQLIKRFLENN